jgi:hypothetical protein
MLDLILTMNNEAKFIANQSVKSVCFSDHHLVSCRLGIQRPSPVTVSYSFRRINSIDIGAFSADIVNSKLFDRSDNVTVDSFAALIDSEVTRILDLHAPTQTRSRRCGLNDSRWLSDEARHAKRLRRRLEKRYHRTRLDADKKAFVDARNAARESIMKSRADSIRRQMDDVNDDHRATWRMANKLLHGKPPVYHDDADCAKLSTSFSDYFIDKISRIRENIAAALQSIPSRQFITRHHFGNKLLTFRLTTSDEVRRVLAKMSSKSSPLDVLPTSLLKSCADVFSPVITFAEGRFPSRYKNAQVMPLLNKRLAIANIPQNVEGN